MHNADISLFHWINHGWANGLFDWLMPWVSAASKIWSGRILLIAAWLFILLRCGPAGRRAAILIVPAIILANLLADLGKNHLGVLRPCVELSDVRLVSLSGVEPGAAVPNGTGGYSYEFEGKPVSTALTSGGLPSGHAANTAASAAVVFYFFRRRAWFIWLLPVSTGLSRIYVGVHFPSQVLAGWLLGAAIGFGLARLFRIRESADDDTEALVP